ncbi:hypothetical protein C8J57DRAFT_1483206 [Mycena rebaudengoi]|nr:hypothetical protein C8J57DRAFT_1483206 [Mycena rebaudengoi]
MPLIARNLRRVRQQPVHTATATSQSARYSARSLRTHDNSVNTAPFQYRCRIIEHAEPSLARLHSSPCIPYRAFAASVLRLSISSVSSTTPPTDTAAALDATRHAPPRRALRLHTPAQRQQRLAEAVLSHQLHDVGNPYIQLQHGNAAPHRIDHATSVLPSSIAPTNAEPAFGAHSRLRSDPTRRAFAEEYICMSATRNCIGNVDRPAHPDTPLPRSRKTERAPEKPWVGSYLHADESGGDPTSLPHLTTPAARFAARPITAGPLRGALCDEDARRCDEDADDVQEETREGDSEADGGQGGGGGAGTTERVVDSSHWCLSDWIGGGGSGGMQWRGGGEREAACHTRWDGSPSSPPGAGTLSVSVHSGRAQEIVLAAEK